jgi:hypothetical protein
MNQIEVGRRIEGMGGWLLLAAIVVAPWWYGSTRVEAIWALGFLLVAAGVLGLAGCCCKRRFPRVPAPCWGSGAAVIVLGWGLVPVSAAHLLSETSLAAVTWNLGRWPASTTVRPPAAMALLATGMVLALLLSADLGRNPLWRRRILLAMAVTGASLAIFGVAQVALGAESIFGQQAYWDQRDVLPGHFFATFFHHSVAGAFLNLTWPLALGLLLAARLGRSAFQGRGWEFLFGACAAVVLLAVVVNVSKAGLILAVLLLLGFALWPGLTFFRSLRPAQQMAAAGGIVLVLVAGLFLGRETGRLQLAEERWQEWYMTVSRLPAEMQRTGGIPTEPPFDRFAAASVSLEMAQQSRLWGFGPGSWMRTFPEFTGEMEFEPFWLWMQFAHQDYLQTLVEWGAIGAMLWGILIFGALFVALRVLRRSGWDLWGSEAISLYVILISLTGLLLHAAGDFPLQIPSIQLYAFVLLGFCWSAPAWRLADGSPAFRPRRRMRPKTSRPVVRPGKDVIQLAAGRN